MRSPFSPRNPFKPSNPWRKTSSGELEAPAPSYVISGAIEGEPGVESENITITGYNLTGPVEISYTSDDPGDTFDVPTVTIDVGDTVKNIKITPDATVGVRTITFTSDPDIYDPGPWEYDASVDDPTPSGNSLDFSLSSNSMYVGSLV